MKWSNRIAQGFSPGWGKSEDRPESGNRAGPFLPARPSQTVTLSKHPELIQRHTFGRHFQGDLGVALPRAKALGYSV
jgi:hypothetical protein